MSDKKRDLKELVVEHEAKLIEIIDTFVEADEEERSYVSKKEVENMLENHFIRIENLFKAHTNQSKAVVLTDQYDEIRKNLKSLSDDFVRDITDGIASAKEKLGGSVTKLTDSVRDKVTEVKENAKIKIKQMILNINEDIKEWTNMIDEKFAIPDTEQAANRSEKKQRAVEHER